MFNPINALLGMFSHDIGIDLGTANTLVMVRGGGVVINEPSVVAIDKLSKKVIAIGSEAKRMVGRTPANIVAARPLKDGVITDFEVTERMLNYFINRVHERFSLIFPRPRVVVGIPSGVTEVEKRAVRDAVLNAGAREAYLIEEPMAAAMGIGLTIHQPQGALVVDIGGGTTEIALISLGGIVIDRCLRIAGDEMDEALINFVKLKYALLLGQASAEDIKIQLGSAIPPVKSSPEQKEKQLVIRGRDLENGLPKSIKISSEEVREAIAPVIHQIVEQISEVIEEAPPEMINDIVAKGIVLCGGGALISGLDRLISEETKIPVWIADDPQTCVVRGCGKVLEDETLLRKVKVIGGLR